jgi:hypothetical protein
MALTRVMVAVAVCSCWGLGVSSATAANVRAERATVPAAALRLPVGTDGRGVLARRHGGEVELTFTSRAAARYRRIAGRRVDAGCTTILETGPAGDATDETDVGQVLVAPRMRRSFSADIGGGHFDFCTVKLDESKPSSAVEIASVAVSRHGAIYLSERHTARDVLYALFLVSLHASRTPPSAARIERLSRGYVVPLSGPTARPPAGRVGYWTDGRAETHVAELTFDGTVFFFDSSLGTGVVTTNLLGWIESQMNSES